ncbi:hypothetical protein RRG08_012237 [Elysia crispata]|uniref:Uncharacterized protein n=1 Tax=Elysia crispata TaxID=231223 RepID=A0AAE0YP97_9GAST|nr:hypothetical protein RRG08_012237 [Elysia crispata]
MENTTDDRAVIDTLSLTLTGEIHGGSEQPPPRRKTAESFLPHRPRFVQIQTGCSSCRGLQQDKDWGLGRGGATRDERGTDQIKATEVRKFAQTGRLSDKCATSVAVTVREMGLTSVFRDSWGLTQTSPSSSPGLTPFSRVRNRLSKPNPHPASPTAQFRRSSAF